MQKDSLHITIRKAVNQFGMNILNEVRLVNILSDLGGFNDIPASKIILKVMIADGYCQKICDFWKKGRSFPIFSKKESMEKPEGEEWKHKLISFSVIITSKKGFKNKLVDYVINCIVYGLSWSEVEPRVTLEQRDSANSIAPKPLPNAVSSGTNKNKDNSVSYNAIEETQFVVMKVTPIHAEVFIDGEQQYVSNGVMATELKVGNHTYEVKAESYTSKAGNFTISKSDKTELEEKKITLMITSSDSDAEIIINGLSFGIGKWQGLVESGTYEIEITKPRFYPYKETIIAGNNKLEKRSIPSLKPIHGNLKINVQPYGSEIFINGENKGTTPLLVPDLQDGDRIIRIVTEEGTEYSVDVEVRENQVTDVNHIVPSIFISDYSQVKVGDYYYEDGSISHVIAKNKTIVGMVFSLETSEEEKRHGWTHGQIVALNGAKLSEVNDGAWGHITDSLLCHTISNPNMGKNEGYAICHMDCIVNNPDFTPFYIVAKYNAKLPNGKTFGWYLPGLIQWKTMWENTHEDWIRIWRYLKLTDIHGIRRFATSSLMDNKYAWIFTMGYSEEYKNQAYKTKDINDGWGYSIAIRSVAAF